MSADSLNIFDKTSSRLRMIVDAFQSHNLSGLWTFYQNYKLRSCNSAKSSPLALTVVQR